MRRLPLATSSQSRAGSLISLAIESVKSIASIVILPKISSSEESTKRNAVVVSSSKPTISVALCTILSGVLPSQEHIQSEFMFQTCECGIVMYLPLQAFPIDVL